MVTTAMVTTVLQTILWSVRRFVLLGACCSTLQHHCLTFLCSGSDNMQSPFRPWTADEYSPAGLIWR